MCGVGLTTGYAGQIMHQPAWSLFDAISLAGIVPTATGFDIRPELPVRTFSLALPNIGVAYTPSSATGYVVAAATDELTMSVHVPSGTGWRVDANGRPSAGRLRGGMLTFRLRARREVPAVWKIIRTRAAHR